MVFRMQNESVEKDKENVYFFGGEITSECARGQGKKEVKSLLYKLQF
jgi:hypothetical protein